MSPIRQKSTESKIVAPAVYVVDGDSSVLEGVRSLLTTLGARVLCFRSAEQLLDSIDFDRAACLVTEVHLPGMSGFELLKTLRGFGVSYPVIVMTSDADIPMATRAMSLGALDFIEKPFVDRVLIARVREALQPVS